MITDFDANALFLADCLPLRHPVFYKRLVKVLEELEVCYELLPGTKDIWAVDYMPIQVREDKFVDFTYFPDYLRSKKGMKSITDVDAVCRSVGIETVKSPVALDGGNVIKAADKVILCDKIFDENPGIGSVVLIQELRQCFEVNSVFFVPRLPGDEIGHADGMVRFLDDHTVLINDYSKEKPAFQRGFLSAVHNTGLDYITIPYNPYGNRKYSQANGIYINYLQMGERIILPDFGLPEDRKVFNLFRELFPGFEIRSVDCNEIADQGGVLNCITWNVLL